MNAPQLANYIRVRSRALRHADESPVTIQQLAEDGELLLALARIVEGHCVETAFGAPGDWGYNHPVGRALAAKTGGL